MFTDTDLSMLAAETAHRPGSATHPSHRRNTGPVTAATSTTTRDRGGRETFARCSTDVGEAGKE